MRPQADSLLGKRTTRAPKTKPKPKTRYYVIQFVDGGFNEVISRHRTRATANAKASKLRAEWRPWNREHPSDEVTYHVESNNTMPFDPEAVR